MNNETMEMKEQENVEKVYTFRKLQSTDMFLMFKLLSKLGIKTIFNGVGQDNINNLVSTFFKNKKKAKGESVETEQGETVNEEAEKGETVNGVFIDVAAGISAASGLVDTFLCNMSYCENEVYEMLANTSNLSVEQIKTLDFITFTEMVIDFIKKDEFKGFIKVVLKSFKRAN